MKYAGFRGIVISDGKIALIERWKKGRHFFVLPGGRLEAGETAKDCVTREIREELNIVIKPKSLIYDLVDFKKQGIFYCEWISGTIGKTDAEEYQENRKGGDYEPVLVDLSALKYTNLVPKSLKSRILVDLENGNIATRKKIQIFSAYRGK